jgi:hypothetical protein
MAPTPAKFRLEQSHGQITVPRPLGTTSTRVESPNNKILQEQENRPQSSTPYSSPFSLPVRKSPLSPRRTTIVQAKRQQHSAAVVRAIYPSGNKITTSSKSPPPVSLPTGKESQSNDVNAQPLAIKPRTPRTTFVPTRDKVMRQQEHLSQEQENIQKQQESISVVSNSKFKTLCE